MPREFKIVLFALMGLLSCIGAFAGYIDTRTIYGALLLVVELWMLVSFLVVSILVFVFIGSKIFKDDND